ncbi:MAG: ImmA/IrrE family metallo-endopeptidase, partial [Verrucomicrobia bacterium]|nr:ImmA/IrrE family metallo-endopeptidase [Verrucomicrobiota bacterium]
CGRSIEELSARSQLRKLAQWESGKAAPTLRQLEVFACATYVPVGYLFLPTPPREQVPIPDLRTIGNEHIGHPSPDLLDTIHICQQRQAWYRDHTRSAGHKPVSFVGSADRRTSIPETAQRMRDALGFSLEARRHCLTWTDALRRFIEHADEAGVLVMTSGVVGGNNRRALDPEEFRGFALSDEYAPLVFINGKDTKAAQAFTLAHELAHIWLGESALSDVGPASRPSQSIEAWCNMVAAELLVPLDVVRQELTRADPLDDVPRLARRFKVSTLVILRRILDAERIDRTTFQEAYREEADRLRAILARRGGGGDYYLTTGARVSKRFAGALVVSTFEGHTPFTEAFRMLGMKKMSTLKQLGHELGVGI